MPTNNTFLKVVVSLKNKIFSYTSPKLQILWMAHFVLSSWAVFPVWLPQVYMYTHLGVLGFGVWAFVSKESADAALMFFTTLLLSILNDILCLALYQPTAYEIYEGSIASIVPTTVRNLYRFSLGMAITNLLLKPLTSYYIFCMYKNRSSGTEFDPVLLEIGAYGQQSETDPETPDYQRLPGFKYAPVYQKAPAPEKQ